MIVQKKVQDQLRDYENRLDFNRETAAVDHFTNPCYSGGLEQLEVLEHRVDIPEERHPEQRKNVEDESPRASVVKIDFVGINDLDAVSVDERSKEYQNVVKKEEEVQPIFDERFRIQEKLGQSEADFENDKESVVNRENHKNDVPLLSD